MARLGSDTPACRVDQDVPGEPHLGQRIPVKCPLSLSSTLKKGWNNLAWRGGAFLPPLFSPIRSANPPALISLGAKTSQTPLLAQRCHPRTLPPRGQPAVSPGGLAVRRTNLASDLSALRVKFRRASGPGSGEEDHLAIRGPLGVRILQGPGTGVGLGGPRSTAAAPWVCSSQGDPGR